MKPKFTFLLLICLIVLLAPNLRAQTAEITKLDKLSKQAEEDQDYQKAIAFALESHQLKEKAVGKSDSIYHESLRQIGTLYQLAGKYTDAEGYFVADKEASKKYYGKESANYCESLNNLALLYADMCRYEEAEKLFLDDIRITEQLKGIESLSYAKSMENLGTLYKTMGRYEEAEKAFVQSRDLRNKLFEKKDMDYASIINNLAGLYKKLGRFEESERMYFEVRDIFKELLNTNHYYYGIALNNLATLYWEMHRYKEAEPLYLEALSISEKTLGKKHPKYAIQLKNLAQLYRDTERDTEAGKYYRQALKIVEDALGTGHFYYLSFLQDYASFLGRRGKIAEAISLLNDVAEKQLKLLGSRNSSYAQTLLALSDIYEKEKVWDKALYYCLKSFLANSTNALDSLPYNTEIYGSLAQLDFIEKPLAMTQANTLTSILKGRYTQSSNDKQHLEELNKCYNMALLLSRRLLVESSSENDRNDLLKYSSKFAAAGIEQNLSNTVSEIEIAKAFDFAEINKATLLSSALKAKDAVVFGELPDSLHRQEQALAQKIDKIKASYLSATLVEKKLALQRELSQANVEMYGFQNKLKKDYPKYYEAQFMPKQASIQAIQEKLDAQTILLAYSVADKNIHLFAISQKEVKYCPLAISKTDLQERSVRLRKALSDYELIAKDPEEAYRLYTENAYWFYENLGLKTACFTSNSGKITSLIIVPDGELAHLPFEAFLTEKAPENGSYSELRYLLRTHKISYNYSATLWNDNKEASPKKHNGKILAFAASYGKEEESFSYLSRSPHMRSLRDALQDLPAAREEVKGLEKRFIGKFLYDEKACEKTLKVEAKDYAIIHLAMHGLLNSKEPILSSLAFTENGDTTEDNFLQAHEISRLDLNAQLVVLSACETGYGRFQQGEGVMSLARSFMYAGVPSLVVSMWQVNDASTAIIMEYFYDYLAEGLDKDEALQKAKLAYIQKAGPNAAHPAFWAAFVQMGDNRPIELKTRANPVLWGAVLASFGLFAIGGYWFNKRRKNLG